MAPVSTQRDGFTFDPSTGPEDSKFKTPSWVKRAPITPAEPKTVNGLGEVSLSYVVKLDIVDVEQSLSVR